MIAVLSSPDVRYPAATDHFSPSDAFPEYGHGSPAATPNTVYADGQGGGARIPDHIGGITGQRCFAAIETMGVA